MSNLHNEPSAQDVTPASAGTVGVVPPHCTLEGFALEPGCVDGVALEALEPDTVLIVRTRYSSYRLVVLDGAERRVLLTGGSHFPESTEVRVDGATAGGSSLKIGWIGVGLRLEMTAGRRRITTSRVESVTIERPATTH